jgi:hypothetical protein
MRCGARGSAVSDHQRDAATTWLPTKHHTGWNFQAIVQELQPIQQPDRGKLQTG